MDTFEEEDLVDIGEVAKKLKDLKKDEVDLRGKLTKFCDELKIDKPF